MSQEETYQKWKPIVDKLEIFIGHPFKHVVDKARAKYYRNEILSAVEKRCEEDLERPTNGDSFRSRLDKFLKLVGLEQ